MCNTSVFLCRVHNRFHALKHILNQDVFRMVHSCCSKLSHNIHYSLSFTSISELFSADSTDSPLFTLSSPLVPRIVCILLRVSLSLVEHPPQHSPTPFNNFHNTNHSNEHNEHIILNTSTMTSGVDVAPKTFGIWMECL